MKKLLLMSLLAVVVPAWADAVDTLKSFVQDVKSGRAAFTQTVTSPDGAKKRTTQGSFAFSRPGRFRFEYDKPFEQLIVADGQKVWLYDPDLNQVTVRPMSQALGATPAALLAGGALEKDFQLKAMADRDGLQWAEAVPREKDSQFQSVRVGFRGGALAALEILDNFGQKSLLNFSQVQSNAAVPADDFRFTPPQGADVLEQ
ncbi:outer membrane lipoprotein chaperone LolA [Schlegelella sp. S2-27]|uniref:Outer-membrane lipoprotein carrier protein n=1 Tax=Caldimonas mangrovi TaxID=2944811 RepID=A0ABT0YJH1_9BURK|nr:outer membrane lipoprotein chaperone LolA [Caldimonas mangrovi]MCM5678863.1 outer membrane lipoprotein chaperone LolA [Caldimonas mangrovi]